MQRAKTISTTHYFWFAAAWLCFLTAGCATFQSPAGSREVERPHALSEPMPVEQTQPRTVAAVDTSSGSLWTDSGDLSQMFISAKARGVGDIVTIHIVESSSASNKASTKTGRSSSLDAGLESFFNLEKDYPSDHPFFNPFGSVKGSINSDFDGSGATARSNALTAYMSARIVDVLANGDFFIEGSREVRVNNENQIIILSGIVRPRDISADNIVQSTFIADARIEYSGTGVINDRQKPGWLTRIFDVVWPF
jgi:flagellar L-ring protein precursor FlgH